jgi:hypothetical protein
MLEFDWQGRNVAVRRLVHSHVASPEFIESLERIARPLQILVVDEESDPLEGDFWLGCSPTRGWVGIDPGKAHWALSLEVPAALTLLKRAARRTAKESAWPLIHAAC